MTDRPELTYWASLLRAGDELAVEKVWQQYFERLVNAARLRFGESNRRTADEEDVAASVLKSLVFGAKEGRISGLASTENLWPLLLAITSQKVIDQVRYEKRAKRGGGNVRGESVFVQNANGNPAGGIDQVNREELSPEFLVMIEEEHQRLMELLGNENLRQVAIWKIEGRTNEEIATRLDVSVHAVGRKVKLIRSLWTDELT